MNLKRVILQVVFVAAASPLIWAQSAPVFPFTVDPSPVVPKPFQFDGSKFKLLPPRGQVMLRQAAAPSTWPCAVARIVKPSDAIDPQIVAGGLKPAANTNSRDITEANVPAPSCLDVVAPQVNFERR